jgi:1-acyl-sn-glycerol-3-phosphate acyltransferase
MTDGDHGRVEGEPGPARGAAVSDVAAGDPVPTDTRAAEPGAPASPVADRPADRVEAVDVHPPTRLERTSYGVLRGLFLGLAKSYFRLEIHGREHVPAHGPFVLAPVHRSNLDFILVSTLTRTRMRYMGKASIWKWRWGGKFVAMLGAFPVHRGSADRDALRTCLQVIENGEPVVMFPEGTRRSGPVVHELFDGPAYVAARTGVPLVPVGIGGSDQAMPVGSKLIRPRKIVLVAGEPIFPPAGDGSGRVRRRVVRELTEQLHSAVQTRYDDARRLVGEPLDRLPP